MGSSAGIKAREPFCDGNLLSSKPSRMAGAWLRRSYDSASNLENAELLEGQNRVLELIAQGAPLAEVLDLLLGVIQEQCPGTLCSILLLDSDGIHMRHGAAGTVGDIHPRSRWRTDWPTSRFLRHGGLPV